MIRLHYKDGRAFLVNPSHLVKVEQLSDGTVMALIHDGSDEAVITRVRESLDEIERMTRSYFWETAAHG